MRTALALLLTQAPSDERLLELDWEAPPACGSATAVEGRVRSLLGPSPSPSGEPLRAEGRITPRGDGGFALRLRLDPNQRPRQLEARTCDELLAAAALVLAIALDPEAVRATPPPRDPEAGAPPPAEPGARPPLDQPGDAAVGAGPPLDQPGDADVGAGPPLDQPAPAEARAAVPEPPTQAAPPAAEPRVAPAESAGPAPAPPPPDARPDPTRPPPPAIRVELGVLAGVGAFILPRPAAEVGLGIALQGFRWRVEVNGTYWTPSERSSAIPGVSGRFMLWTVGVRGCGGPEIRSVFLSLCGGLDVGAMHGEGRGELVARRAMSPWLALTAGPGLLWFPSRRARRIALLLRGEAIAALLRPAFATVRAGEVYQARAAGARLLAGLTVRLR